MNKSNNPIIGNTAGTGINPLNSNINECKNFENISTIAELEIEFGYCSEEESIF